MVSDGTVSPDSGGFTKENNIYFGLSGAKGYVNGINELDKISKLYGQGKYADKEKTRSINVDDINKITGYKPSVNNNGMETYGNVVTYTNDNGELKYKSSVVGSGICDNDFSQFHYFDENGNEETLKNGESKTYTYSAYWYNIGNYVNSNPKVYNVLLKNSKEIDISYFLGSQYTWTHSKNCTFGLMFISGNFSDVHDIMTCDFYQAKKGNNDVEAHGKPLGSVRPAVYLKSNSKLTSSSESGWSIE